MLKTKKILSIIFACLIILSSTSVVCFASSEQPIENFVETDFDGYVEIKKIHDRDLNIIKRGKRLSDKEKLSEITEVLGFEKVQKVDIFNELVDDFENIGDIVTYTKYCVTDSSGNSKIVSKERCLNMIENDKKEEKQLENVDSATTYAARAVSSDGECEDITENIKSGSNTLPKNDYMEISTMIIYKKNEARGTYNFISTYTWLKEPADRYVDAISLYSSSIQWSEKNSDYSSSLIYNEIHSTNGKTTTEPIVIEKTAPDKISKTGIFYSYEMPKAYHVTSLVAFSEVKQEDMTFLLTAKGRVTYYNVPDQVLDTYANYVHVTSKRAFKEITFDISTEAFGVSVTAGAKEEVEYSNYCSWDYLDHANL